MDAGGEGEIKKEKVSVADRLVNIGMRGIRLFHTPDGVGYAAVTLDNGGTAILGTEKTEMRKMLSQRYYKEVGKAPSGTAVADALGIISGIALFDGDEITLNTRVAWKDGNIIYDMSNQKQECVVVTSEGWEVMQSREPMFKRFAHQISQTTPVHGGDITKIFDSVNVAEEDKLMALVHLVSSLVPDIPHPAPSICGEQGTAKSTASKVFKLLIDPSEIDTATMPVNDDRMHQMLSKHHYLIFDNVSWIQDWQSDVFCRAVTGQATALRKLYTDDDDHIFKYKMCVGFNGITYLATRSDLLDRSFALRLVPITDSQRLPEDEVDKVFESNRGQILGGIFDALVKAIEIYPKIELDKLPRMADFTKWGCAIAEGLGYTQKDFLEAYYTKIEESNMNAIDANPVAGLIVDLMENRDDWLGTPTELYNDLLDILSQKGAHSESVKGLTSPRALGKIHDRVSPNLRKIGIDWRILPRTTKGRKHQIVKSEPTTPMDDYKRGVDRNGRPDHVVCTNMLLPSIGDDNSEKMTVTRFVSQIRPMVVNDDNALHVVCTPYLSFFKKGGDREGITIGAQTTCGALSSSIDNERHDSENMLSSSFQELSSSIDNSRHDSDESQTTCPKNCAKIDEPTGKSIMEFIQEKMSSYGGQATDHKFAAVSDMLSGKGYDADTIKFCIKRYREGHRIFIQRVKQA